MRVELGGDGRSPQLCGGVSLGIAFDARVAIVRATSAGVSARGAILCGVVRDMSFITPAWAQGAGAAGQQDLILQLAPFAIILVIMYFLILRPQQKRAKAHQAMIKAVRRGDTVITSGGFIGKVTKVIDDNEIEVELAPDTRVRLVRSMIAEVRAKGEPVKD